MVDEAGWATHEFAVDFIWFTSEATICGVWAVELVKSEEIEILG
jgi:hypothetical protein